MKKRIFALLLAVSAAVGMTACGGKEVETQEVDYDMTFENQTGIDVSKLEIRYAEDADWSEIALTDGEWKSSYQMPVSMEGQMPVAEDGWQVQMTFADGDSQKVWEGVEFADDVILTFALDEDLEPVVTNSVPAPEGDIDETDALAEDLTDETEE
ncbi:MAG: hypothetical protein J6L66_09010 [Anaerotignum sp.]|nr:hypothetical protein [Anaerotignum sp.]MBP3628685.1 hypothetical protein [Anaerotignum sp.]